MNVWIELFGAITAAGSAASLYGASGHCRLGFLKRVERFGRGYSMLFAVVSLASWVAAFGMGVGTCALLLCWMFAAMVLPYAALLGNRHTSRRHA